MDSRISVLMLISRFYPVMAGAEKQALRLSKALQANSIKVTFLTQRLPNTAPYELYENIEIYRVGIPVSGILGSLSYLFMGFFWIMLKRKYFNIVHAHILSVNALLASLTTFVFNVPSIIKIAGSRLTGDISKSAESFIGRLKLNVIKKYSSYFVCPSSEIYDELVYMGFEKSKTNIIFNGVDDKVFKSASLKEKSGIRERLHIPKNEKVVIYTGRLERGKGVEVLIDAWKRLDKVCGAMLIIAGNGSLMRDISALSASANSIELVGWQDNVAEYLMASNIYVIPSFGEGMPNSLLEAMSCSLACIATNIGGIRQIIQDGENGILIEPGNPEILAEKIGALLLNADDVYALGKKAAETIQLNYTIEIITKSYIKLYNNALNIQ